MRHTIEIKWSDEDQCVVVLAPEWEGSYLIPIAEGDSYEEAPERGTNALEQLIELARTRGEPLPAPATFAEA